MSATNPVHNILVTSGNQAVLGAGNRISSLAKGQIGFFNYHTGLSIDGTVPADARDIIIAVGINRSGGATYEDHNESTGQYIQVRNARVETVQGTVIGKPQISDITGFSVKCESVYTLRLNFSNSEITNVIGTNLFGKPFSFKSGCCADQCAPCGDGVTNEVVLGLINLINLDKDKLVTASAIAYRITATVNAGAGASANITVTVGTTPYTVAVTSGQTTAQVATAIVNQINTQADSPYRASVTGSAITIHPKANTAASTATIAITNANGTGVTINTVVSATKIEIADTTTFQTTYPGASLGIRLTSGTTPMYLGQNPINLKYYKNRETSFDVALVEGFNCNGTVTLVQSAVQTQGKGYDLAEIEYEANGWLGKPGAYRQSELTGLAMEGFESFIDKAANYNTIDLGYFGTHHSGMLDYTNNFRTTIAVPCADSATIQGIGTVLDAIFTMFGAMTDDIAALDCDNPPVSSLAANVDGIESLA